MLFLSWELKLRLYQITVMGLVAVGVLGAGHAEARVQAPAAEYIEYRARPELGEISITNGLVRGAKSVEHLTAHAAELAKEGIFACTDEKDAHTYKRKDTIAGRKIETTITISPPPAEKGTDEERTQHLVVRIDGKKKVDCTIGTSADGDVLVYAINIFPEDGSIEVVAVSGDGRELAPPEGFTSFDDERVITDDVLEEPDEGDDAPAEAKTVPA